MLVFLLLLLRSTSRDSQEPKHSMLRWKGSILAFFFIPFSLGVCVRCRVLPRVYRRRRPTSSRNCCDQRPNGKFIKKLLITSFRRGKKTPLDFSTSTRIICFFRSESHIAYHHAFSFQPAFGNMYRRLTERQPEGSRKNRVHNETIKRNANKKNMQISL